MKAKKDFLTICIKERNAIKMIARPIPEGVDFSIYKGFSNDQLKAHLDYIFGELSKRIQDTIQGKHSTDAVEAAHTLLEGGVRAAMITQYFFDNHPEPYNIIIKKLKYWPINISADDASYKDYIERLQKGKLGEDCTVSERGTQDTILNFWVKVKLDALITLRKYIQENTATNGFTFDDNDIQDILPEVNKLPDPTDTNADQWGNALYNLTMLNAKGDLKNIPELYKLGQGKDNEKPESRFKGKLKRQVAQLLKQA